MKLMDISEQMLGNSSAMNMLNLEIKLVADSDLATLVKGEPGTGKELVAQCIHSASGRREKALISVDCGELDDNMLERELFGYEAGAFPDALNSCLGKIELANSGSLFIAEISKMSLSIQEKLFQVIKSGELRRLGSDLKHKVNVRFIASTSSKNLKSQVAEGRFRKDLYHKLTVFPLQVPALRQRDKDVLLLASDYLAKMQDTMGIQHIVLSKDAELALLEYNWPGNVRQLYELLDTAVLRAADRENDSDKVEVQGSDLNIHADTHSDATAVSPVALIARPPKQPAAAQTEIRKPNERSSSAELDLNAAPDLSAGLNLKEATENFQRQFIKSALREQNGNSSAAARAIGVDRSNLHRLVKRLGISKE